MHFGNAPQVRAAAARRIAIGEAERIVFNLGGVIDVDPLDALLEMVHEAAWNVAAYRGAVEKLGVDVGGDESVAPRSVPGGPNAAILHVLVQAYDAERDRLVKFAKVCVDAGVDERRVRLVESQGALLARVVQAAVDACDPTPLERDAAIRAAAGALRAIEGRGL